MTKKKIIAYYINEAERDYIYKYLEVKKVTDSFLIGDIDENGEKDLVDFGIILRSIERLHDEQFYKEDLFLYRTFFSDWDYSTERWRDYFNIKAIFPAYFSLRILGPLLEEYSDYLNINGIAITEFRYPDLYVVRIESQEVFATLRDSDFIENIIPITIWSTPLTLLYKFREKGSDDLKKLGKQMLTYDVLLHREEDMEEFLSFLEQRNIAVAGHDGIKVRIYLLESEPIMFSIIDHSSVREMYEYIPPKLHNDKAKEIIGLHGAAVLPSTFPYYGAGQLIGIADTGIDAKHGDFTGRIKHMQDWGGLGTGVDTDGHGTHVAGTVLGDGAHSAGVYAGAAPKSDLYFQSLLNNLGDITIPFNLKDLFNQAYKDGVRIHNNSWGSSTNSRITAQAIEVDEFVYEKKDMLLVFSAGNEGKSVGASNSAVGYPGLLSIGAPGTAKNILTVGSSRSSRTSWGYSTFTYSTMWPYNFHPSHYYGGQNVSGDSDSLAGFSSRGPSDDYRIKPDIVAPSTDIVSARSAQSSPSNFWTAHPSNNQYAIMGGTSMAAPLVTGCAAIIREYYEKKWNHQPSAALLKATIINGAKKLKGTDACINHPTGPNFDQGFGMIDMQNSIPLEPENFFFHYVDNYLEPTEHLITGKKSLVTIELRSLGWIRVCLAYTDLPARALQNDLNLIVDYANPVKKWLGNEDAYSFLKGLDSRNNVERVIIEDAPAGRYNISVIGSNIIKGAQDFALIITASSDTIIV
ncbi:S8 family serine peptidase [Flavobacterium notoginsengisoli]|uniref:S8 family serine peptidase n=1 Tax=Flavobacterium notoginsengisoli TaxID=1478199 RepID=UPI003625A97F